MPYAKNHPLISSWEFKRPVQGPIVRLPIGGKPMTTSVRQGSVGQAGLESGMARGLSVEIQWFKPSGSSRLTWVES